MALLLLMVKLLNVQVCEEIVSDLLKIPESADFIDLVDKKKVWSKFGASTYFKGMNVIHYSFI